MFDPAAPPNIRVTLFGGPHDGTELMVYAATHAVHYRADDDPPARPAQSYTYHPTLSHRLAKPVFIWERMTETFHIANL